MGNSRIPILKTASIALVGFDDLDTARDTLTEVEARFVRRARVARLGTASGDGQPNVVPVCFELLGGSIYIGLDSKPKSVAHLRLRRVRNILENPRASFLVDRYDEDWGRLGYVMISGSATLDMPETERSRAIEALRAKYPQYERMLPDDALVIRLAPVRVSSWGNLEW